jgi:ABC-type antimicrobial peptide transport system permease subunit
MSIRYIFNELRRRHHRTLVNILGIAVGIALFVSINAVSAAYQKAASQPFENIGADLVVQQPEKRSAGAAQTPTLMRGIRLPFSNQILSAEDLVRLANLNGVMSMAGSLLLWEFDQGGFRTILGVDLSQPSLGPVKVREWLKEGRFPQTKGEAILEKHYAKFHHTRLNDTVAINGRSFKVVGLLEIREGAQIVSSNIYLPLQDAQDLLGVQPGTVNVVFIHLKSPSLLTQVKSQIGKELPRIAVASSDSSLELMGGVSRISDQFSFLASFIAFGGAVLLIIKSMLASLVERAGEIGVLKVVGWSGRDVRRQLMGEVLLQSLAGGVAGIVIGYGLSLLLGLLSVPIATPWQVNLLPAFAKEATVATVRLPVQLSIGLTTAALGLSLGSGCLATYFVARKTAKMKPADILRRM